MNKSYQLSIHFMRCLEIYIHLMSAYHFSGIFLQKEGVIFEILERSIYPLVAFAQSV